MKKLYIIFTALFSWVSVSADDDFCGERNTAFKAGESLTYNVFYNVIGIYVNAGAATFATTLEKLNNQNVYHVTATGVSNSKYDWIFKVRDKYETFIDTGSMQPVKFIRNVNEGGYKKNENITFNHQTHTAVSTAGVYKVPACVHDVISAIYSARNIDFSKYKVNDRIPFNMFLDNEVYSLYVRYLGKETVKTKYGKFRCHKFKPLLLKGNIFKGGEDMNVWVTDDGNHFPVRVESPISIGSVKVDLMLWSNNRYPVSSLISW